MREADPAVLRENVFGGQFVARIQRAIQDQMPNALGKLFAEASRGELAIGHYVRWKEIVESICMMIWSSYIYA